MKYKKFFITMFVLILFSSLSALLAPIFIQIWKTEGTQLSLEKIMFIVLLILISKCLTILFTVIRERFAKDYNKANFKRYLSQIFDMDYDCIIEKGPMNLLERASIAVNSIYTFMTTGYLQIYSSIVVAIVCLILIANINIVLSLIMLAAIPINYFGYKFLNNNLKKKSEEMQKQTGEGFQEILSYVQEVDYLKQLPDRDIIYAKLDNATEKIYGSMAKVNEYAQSMTVVLEGINEIIKILLLLLVVYDYSTANSGLFSIILVTMIFPLYFYNINIITNANIEKRNFDIAKEFEQELIANIEKDGHAHLDSIDEVDINIDQLKVKDMVLPFVASGKYKKGDIIRINGANGSGKSTFGKGLVKFRDLGNVKFNGIPIGDCSNVDVRKNVEYVVQNAPIINGTLKTNLLLTAEGIDTKDLENNPFIKTILEKKTLDDEILANGANLSGGEKQKISFARALLSGPDVLILDEICSNIDKESRDDIYKYLHETRNERITFIISHDDLPEGLANHSIN
ncbi:MAG TPA: ABC transporter ATP-binding protein [Soehngenia sp.]|nr:ABC transporter ATP-binding protein [Soehngenia sp.]